jgi:hypothetical protein
MRYRASSFKWEYPRLSPRSWDNVEKYGGDRGAKNDVTTWRIQVARCIKKATCTHAYARAQAAGYSHAHNYMCCIYCFFMATMICESASMLRCTYIISLLRVPHKQPSGFLCRTVLQVFSDASGNINFSFSVWQLVQVNPSPNWGSIFLWNVAKNVPK